MGALYKIALPSLAIALALISGCRPAGPLARAGISVTPPASWRPAQPSASKIPGVSLAAWTGPDGSSLVLYRTLPAPGGSAKMIGEALANRLSNLPGLKLVVHRMETVAGTPIAPAGKSLLPTREVTLGFHRPDATLFLTWNIPESSYGRLAPEIDATLESVRFAARGTPSFSGY
jgi:hypothetical protein